MSARRSWVLLWSVKEQNAKEQCYVTRLYIWLLSSHPAHKEQWGWFLFSKHLWGMAWGETWEAAKLCSWTSRSQPGRCRYSLHTFLEPEPASNLSHSHPLWQALQVSILSLTAFPALPPRSPRTFVFLLPFECPISDLVVPCDSKEQNLIAQELPVYPMLLTLKTITTFKILEVNGENLSSVGLYRQNTNNCPAPIH